MKKLIKISLIASIALSSSPLLAFNLGSTTSMAGAVASSALSDNSLINSLTNLDVSSNQAVGGTAAIMNKAKGSMDSSDYSSLISKVPGLSGITQSPVASSLSSSSSLSSQFESLGMDADMVKKFMPIIQDYAGKYTPPTINSP